MHVRKLMSGHKKKRVLFGRVFKRSGSRCAGQRTSGVETRLQGGG